MSVCSGVYSVPRRNDDKQLTRLVLANAEAQDEAGRGRGGQGEARHGGWGLGALRSEASIRSGVQYRSTECTACWGVRMTSS